jgi:hypothetical protein
VLGFVQEPARDIQRLDLDRVLDGRSHRYRSSNRKSSASPSPLCP